MTTRYAFYPGCTLHSTGVEFGASTELVCRALDLEMVEIPDWNCCGVCAMVCPNKATLQKSLEHGQFLAMIDAALL